MTPSDEGFMVLNGLLTRNHEMRLTAAEALKLPWFAVAAN
jgi:serine/threonine protein kinase